MTVLVTGCSGLVGSHLVRELLDRNYRVVGLHRTKNPQSTLRMMGLEDEIAEVLGDVTDYKTVESVITYHEPDIIFHLAAIARVRQAAKSIPTTFDVNVMGTVNVLEAVKRVDPDIKVLSMQTDKVYGEGLKAGINKPLQVGGAYETSKICTDYISRMYLLREHLPVVIPRCCNCVGYEVAGGRIVSNTIISCLEGENPVIFTNVKGVREYIYAEDLARALIELAEEWEGVYNIGTGIVKGQEEVVETILTYFSDLEPDYRKKEGVEEISEQSMMSSFLDDHHSFEEAIESTIEDFRRFGYVK